MSYQLFRANTAHDTPSAGNLLGTYPDYTSALAARDDDVLRQLEQACGRRVELTHLIVGAGSRGPRTPHAISCAVGQPTNGPVDLRAELDETGRWLARLHGDR